MIDSAEVVKCQLVIGVRRGFSSVWPYSSDRDVLVLQGMTVSGTLGLDSCFGLPVPVCGDIFSTLSTVAVCWFL